jgi:hypothetical protein
VGYICHRRQDYFKSTNPLAVADRFLKNMLYVLLLNAFQHDRIILKRGRVIFEINPFEALRS